MFDSELSEEEKQLRLRKQRVVGLIWMFSGLLLLLTLLARRGHPKNWRVNEQWVSFWGGDWNTLIQEMEQEERIRVLEQRHHKYMNLVNAGFECDVGDHRVCFEKLCIQNDCDLDELIAKYSNKDVPPESPPEVYELNLEDEQNSEL